MEAPGTMENVHDEAKSEEVAPEMRGAIGRAGNLLAVESFVQDADRYVSLADECALGSDRATCANARFQRFCVLSIWGNFMNILGRRVCALPLSDAQQRVVLSRGADFRAALRRGRATDSQTSLRARDRDAALGHKLFKMSRAPSSIFAIVLWGPFRPRWACFSSGLCVFPFSFIVGSLECFRNILC